MRMARKTKMGDTTECPECNELRNGVMTRHISDGNSEYCCFECADMKRSNIGQTYATEPPTEPRGYNLKDPEPDKIFKFGKNDTPILASDDD